MNTNSIQTEKILHAIYENDKFKSIVNRYFQVFTIKDKKSHDELKVDFEIFLFDIINSKFSNLENEQDIKDLRRSITSNMLKLKKRWAKSAIDSWNKEVNILLRKEYNDLVAEQLKYGEIISVPINTPSEIYDFRKIFLEEWMTNSVQKTTEYPYILDLSSSKIKSAFTYDLSVCITEIIRDDYNFDFNKMTLFHPEGLYSGLFQPHKRGKKANNMGVSEVNKLYYETGEYDVLDDTGRKIDVGYNFSPQNNEEPEKIEQLVIELANRDGNKSAIPKLYLDQQDLDIIRFAYSQSTLNIYSFNMSDLLNFMGLSKSGSNIRRMKDKLLKLPFYVFYTKEIGGNKEIESTFSLFSKIDVITDKKFKSITVKITKSYNEDFQKKTTKIVYEKELKKLSSDNAINLAYLLEGQKNYLIDYDIYIKDKYYRFEIDYLKSYVHLNSKLTSRQKMLAIEEAFNEIKENQFIIKDFKMGKTHFEVLFNTNDEKRQLLLNNALLSLPEHLKP